MAIERIKEKKADYDLIDKLSWILTVLFLALVCILSSNIYGSTILLVCSILVFLSTCIKTKGVIKVYFSKFHIYWIVFILYATMSSLWAWEFSRTITMSMTMFKFLLCISLIYMCYQESEDVWKLYNAVRWSGVVVCLYIIFMYGLDAIVFILLDGKRLHLEFVNINTVGVLAAFTVIISIYEVLYLTRKVFLILLCIPCLIVIAASGTRKALLVLFIGIGMLSYFKFKSRSFINTFIRLIFIGGSLLIASSFILSMPMFASIMKRMESLWALFTGEGIVDNSVLMRSEFIEIGIEQFFRTPLWGIGIGNSGVLLNHSIGIDTYLHNNFVELLCCGGVVGFTIYYSMFGYFIWKFYKYRNYSESLVKLGLVMAVIFVVMDVARVTYYSKPTMFYTMIFFLHIDRLKRTVEKNETK